MLHPEPFRYHFFVSYTTREQEVRTIKPHVEHFIKELHKRGFKSHPFWLDLAEIGNFDGSNEELREELARAIDRCISLIAFVSPGYIKSEFCRFEFRHIGYTSPPHPDLFFRAELVWKTPFDALGHPLAAAKAAYQIPFDPIDANDNAPPNHRLWETTLQSAESFLLRCYRERILRWNYMRPRGPGSPGVYQ